MPPTLSFFENVPLSPELFSQSWALLWVLVTTYWLWQGWATAQFKTLMSISGTGVNTDPMQGPVEGSCSWGWGAWERESTQVPRAADDAPEGHSNIQTLLP